MYQQYNQYQQQAQAPASVEGGMVWNGAAWVNQGSAASGNFSVYQIQQSQDKNSQVIPPDPVNTFTRYYHGWTAHEKTLSDRIRMLSQSSGERQRLDNERQWAKYYADNSSRAAHHFYQNPNAASAPFELPPEPPSNRAIGPQVANQRQVHDNGSYNHTAKSGGDEPTPGSLTRFVKRNLELCKNDQEKKLVQAQIEKRIATAIQEGNLQTKNWDVEPMLVNSSQNTSPQPQIQQKQYYGNYGNRDPVSATNNTNYYGPAGDAAPTSSIYGTRLHNVQCNPAASNASSSFAPFAISSSSLLQKHSNKEYNGKKNNFKNKNHKRRLEEGHYGPADQIGGEDFLALPAASSSPSSAARKFKKHKTAVKDHGLDTSQQALAKRANRFSGPGGIQDASSSFTALSTTSDKYMGKRLIGGSNVTLDEADFEQMTVKGTSTTLEKEYLRLTAPPRAELVRPLFILKQHLMNLKKEYYSLDDTHGNRDGETLVTLSKRERTPQKKWDCKESSSHRRHDYLWFCSQLKAVRQDCTVQRIQGDFAVDVYETHARIALQEGDLNEYNQCQTQLKELYKYPRCTDSHTDNTCTSKNPSSGWENQEEFIAYRLLYYVFLSTNEKYSGGSSDMFHIMLTLTSNQREHPAIRHALLVREAVTFSDYFRFFRLVKHCPNLGIFLMDLLVPTMRMRGLRRIAKAFRPSLELDVCLQQLGFMSDEDSNDNRMEQGKEWLKACGAVVDGTNFLTKDSEIHEPDSNKKSSLI